MESCLQISCPGIPIIRMGVRRSLRCDRFTQIRGYGVQARRVRRMAPGLIICVVLAFLGVTVASGAQAALSGTTHSHPSRGVAGVSYLCGPSSAYACTNGGYAGSDSWGYAAYDSVNAAGQRHNCTTYVAFRLAQNGVARPSWSANANGWATDAFRAGTPVDQTPAGGSIAEWNGGSAGHVAYVEASDATGITITDDNYYYGSQAPNGGYTDRIHIAVGSPSWPDNFIHFKDAVVGLGGSPGPNGQLTGLLGQWNRWNNGDHSALVGTPPAGAVFESTLGDLMASQAGGTVPLYSCYVGRDEFTSPASNCEGQRFNGLLGYIYPRQPSGVVTRAIYRCIVPSTGDHFDSSYANCEGQRSEGRLGYVVSYVAWNRWNNGDHSALVGTPPAGAVFESTLGDLMASQAGGTVPLYSCYVGRDEFTSPASNCEGQRFNGLLGYIYPRQPSGVVTRAIYRCIVPSTGDHFDSSYANCEGQRSEGRLGYVVSYVAWNRWNNGDHSALVGTPPAGAVFESTLGDLMASQAGGTVPLYSCYVGRDEFTSPASNCEGQRFNGLLGYIYPRQPSGVVTRAIYRCIVPSTGDHFDSSYANCEGQRSEGRLGYVVSYL